MKGLELASGFNANQVSVISDSELIVRQMNGQYRVKNEALRPLYQEAKKHAGAFAEFAIRHVPRSENKAADRLANEGIKKGLKTSGLDGRAQPGEESPSATGQNAG